MIWLIVPEEHGAPFVAGAAEHVEENIIVGVEQGVVVWCHLNTAILLQVLETTLSRMAMPR